VDLIESFGADVHLVTAEAGGFRECIRLAEELAATLSTGHRIGRHRIQGISDEFIPPIVDLKFLDSVIAVEDGDAILMAQRLARRLGLAVGISSGANLLGAVLAQDMLGPDAVVVTIFPDSNKKYLSTDLVREEPVRDDYRAPEVELLGFHGFGRTCDTCWSAEAPSA